MESSKSPKLNLSNVNNLNLDISEIKMTFDEPINVTPKNNSSKRIKRSGIYK